MPERVLLLWPTTTYRATDFLLAAERLGVEVVIGSDRCHELAKIWQEGALPLDFRDLDRSVSLIRQAAHARPLRAIVATDDLTTLLAARAARELGLPGNSVGAVEAARNKHLLRSCLSRAGVATPDHRVHPADADPALLHPRLPCVVKPLALSASRGVIAATDFPSFCSAFSRVASLVRQPEVAAKLRDAAAQILVEDFVAGPEVALEALLIAGELHPLALFDKPDPLDGPFFEETLYVTPSRLPGPTQAAIVETAARAATALGLHEGPVHAELRVTGEGPVVIECAARSIGGLCSRTLRFGTGHSLEEIILAHALGRDLQELPLSRERLAAGVLMLPIPKRGVLREVRNQDAARAIPGIEEVTITAPLGQELLPLPEGSSYLGFVFARAEQPEQVENALRQAQTMLECVMAPTLEVL